MLEMDENAPIEQNREALKRILASLVAMAGLAGGASTLPRHLHCAILRLLRPAESAVRRLIIAAALGLVVVLPSPRAPKPKPPIRGPRAFMPVNPKKRSKPAPRAQSLPLLDPLKRYFRVRRRYVPAHAAPRIRWLGGFDSPFLPKPPPPPAPPSPDDPIDAARLSQRLAVLGAARTTCPARRNASPAGRRATMRHWRGTAKHATPQSLRASMAQAWCRSGAARRCDGDVRPAAGCRATIRPRPIPEKSARSTRSWPTPMRWRNTRWIAPTRPEADSRTRNERSAATRIFRGAATIRAVSRCRFVRQAHRTRQPPASTTLPPAPHRATRHSDKTLGGSR